MQIPRSILLALFGALAAYAQTENGPNYFTNPSLSASAGTPLTLTWEPTTEGTVSLILRQGPSDNLRVVGPIAENIPNSGSYTWTPTDADVRGSDYSIEIRDDADESQTNYSAYFVLDSPNTVASTSADSSASATSLSTSLSTASPTSGSASSTGTESSSATETNESTTTGSTSSSSTATSTRSPSASDLQATSSSSEAAGARATAMVGLLGAVALGAIAL